MMEGVSKKKNTMMGPVKMLKQRKQKMKKYMGSTSKFNAGEKKNKWINKSIINVGWKKEN